MAKPIELQLKLPPKPAFARPEMAPALGQGPIAISLVDARGDEDPSVVGVLREKGVDKYRWSVSEPVAASVAGFVTQLLTDWSVAQAPDGELSLKIELTRYFVTEKPETFGSNYVAEVRFKTSLVERSGHLLWTGESSGEAKRPGVDGRAAMCNEALSIALRSALASALSSVKLETPAPAPAAPAASAEPARTTIEPDALLADLTRLKAGGVADDVLVSYVEQRKLSRPLTVDEILRWKNAGIPDAAIKSASK